MNKHQAEYISETIVASHRTNQEDVKKQRIDNFETIRNQRKWAIGGAFIGAAIGYYLAGNLLFGFLAGSGAGVLLYVVIVRRYASPATSVRG